MQVKRRKKTPVYPVGKHIAVKRNAAGMSQIDLASRLGVTNFAVSNWECEENNPGCDVFPMLADVFGCTIDELFGYVAATTPPQRAEFLRLLDELDQHDCDTLLVTMSHMAERHKR